MSHGYSDLQVVHDQPGLECSSNNQPGLEYLPPSQGQNGGAQSDQNYDTTYSPAKYYSGDAPAPDSKKICGLAPRKFWVVAGVIGILVVAAAGGGVGGALASKSAHTENTTSTSLIQSAGTTTPIQNAGSTQGASASSSSPSSSPSSSTHTVTLSTSTITGGSPESTLLSDCPSSNNTLYTVNVGQEMSFRKVCGASYLNTLSGGNGLNSVNLRTLSLDDCIVECATYNFQNKSGIAAGQNNVCNAVCWRNTFTNDEFPGQCFGYTTQNSSSNFVVHSEAICDSAAWIDQNL